MDTRLIKFLQARSFKGFKSKPLYSRAGDFFKYFISGEDHFAERIDDVLIVYKSMSDPEKMTGFKLKGLTCLVKHATDLRLEIHEGDSLKLQMLMLLAGQGNKDESALKVYRFFTKKVQGVKLQTATETPMQS